MSEQEGQTHLALNQRDQPVELHFEGRVVVLPPYGQAELSKQELESPQLQVLIRERLVTVEERKAAGAEEEAEAPSPGHAPGGGEAAAETGTGGESGEGSSTDEPSEETDNSAEKGDV